MVQPLRVFQLESAELDDNLGELFMGAFGKIFKYYKSHVPQQYEADLNLAINFIIWKYSLGLANKCSPGQEMMGLRYANATSWHFLMKYSKEKSRFSSSSSSSSSSVDDEIPRAKIIGVFLLKHVFPYMVIKNSTHPSSSSSPPTSSSPSSPSSPSSSPSSLYSLPLSFKNKISYLISSLNRIVKVLRIINFVLFLKFGKFPKLSERLLVLEYRSLYPIGVNQVTCDIYHREALWQGLIEFLTFIISSINFHKALRIGKECIFKRDYGDLRRCGRDDKKNDDLGGKCEDKMKIIDYKDASIQSKMNAHDEMSINQSNQCNDDDNNDNTIRKVNSQHINGDDIAADNLITNDDDDNGYDDDDNGYDDDVAFDPEDLKTCSICSQWPIEPCYNVICRHIYCFYCVHSKLGGDDGYKCEMCGCAVANHLHPIPPSINYAYHNDVQGKKRR